ncbi:MAG TPA: hypothetical protein VJM08_07290, partial [Anaerolineales bacterium]|nr:hypothetical protein [Anaerolineales bacterium]
MSKYIASFLTLQLFLVSCSVSQSTATPLPTEVLPTLPPTVLPNPLPTPWEDRSIFRDGLVTSERSVLDDLSGASIYHIEFTIADDFEHITGAQEVRYTNNEDVP